jgi:hypothetical protein
MQAISPGQAVMEPFALPQSPRTPWFPSPSLVRKFVEQVHTPVRKSQTPRFAHDSSSLVHFVVRETVMVFSCDPRPELESTVRSCVVVGEARG